MAPVFAGIIHGLSFCGGPYICGPGQIPSENIMLEALDSQNLPHLNIVLYDFIWCLYDFILFSYDLIWLLCDFIIVFHMVFILFLYDLGGWTSIFE